VSYAITVTLMWGKGLQFSDGEPTGYKVAYKAGYFGRYKPTVDVGNVLEYKYDLPAGYYCWKVKAYNEAGEGGFSQQICRTLK